MFLLGSDPHHGKKGQQVSSSSSGVIGIHTPDVMPCVVVHLSSSLLSQDRLVALPFAVLVFHLFPLHFVVEGIVSRFQVSQLITEQTVHFFASFLLDD